MGAPGREGCRASGTLPESPPHSAFWGPRHPVMVLAQGNRSPRAQLLWPPLPHTEAGQRVLWKDTCSQGPIAWPSCTRRQAAQPRPQAPGCRGHFPTKARREGCTHPSRLAGRAGRGGGIPVAARGPLPALRGGRAEIGGIPLTAALEAALGRGPTPTGAQPAWLPAPRGSDHSEGTRRILRPQLAAESCCRGRAPLPASRGPDSAPAP